MWTHTSKSSNIHACIVPIQLLNERKFYQCNLSRNEIIVNNLGSTLHRHRDPKQFCMQIHEKNTIRRRVNISNRGWRQIRPATWFLGRSCQNELIRSNNWLREKFYPEKSSTPEEVYPEKNPQFLSNLYETWWKYSSWECFKFLQYQLYWIKIVDFFRGRLFPG